MRIQWLAMLMVMSGCMPGEMSGGMTPGGGGATGGGTSTGGDPDGTGNPGTGNPGTGNPGTGNPGTGNPGAQVSGRVIGYFTNWSQYRPGDCKFTAADIDPSLFTHLNYAFAKITSSGGSAQSPGTFALTGYEWNDEGPTGQYAAVNALKLKNPKLKTLLSVGGWGFNDTPGTNWIYSAMVADPGRRAQFIQSAISYIRANGFDGIDFDWEYPGIAARGGSPADSANYTAFLAELRTAVTAEAQASGKAPLLVTLATAAGESNYAPLELGKIQASVDWINLMTYDYHGGWDPTTGANTPLMADSSPGGHFYIDYAVPAYLAAGVPASKLVLGMATYGRAFGGVTTPKLNAPATAGTAPVGRCTREAGFLSYLEISELLATGGYQKGMDTGTSTPFAYDAAGHLVSYDDVDSLNQKLDYLGAKKLGGGMVWAIDLDDFHKGYPLVSAIAKRFGLK